MRTAFTKRTKLLDAPGQGAVQRSRQRPSQVWKLRTGWARPGPDREEKGLKPGQQVYGRVGQQVG